MQASDVIKVEESNWGFCLKLSTTTFPVTSVCTRWPSYLSSRMRSAGSLTAQTLNSLDNSRPSATCHCLSRYTRERASVGAAACRQRFVYETHVIRVRELHGYRQLKGTVRYRRAADDRPTRSSVSQRLTTTVRAPTTTIRAPRRGSSEQRGRRATCCRHRRWAVVPARRVILPPV